MESRFLRAVRPFGMTRDGRFGGRSGCEKRQTRVSAPHNRCWRYASHFSQRTREMGHLVSGCAADSGKVSVLVHVNGIEVRLGDCYDFIVGHFREVVFVVRSRGECDIDVDSATSLQDVRSLGSR